MPEQMIALKTMLKVCAQSYLKKDNHMSLKAVEEPIAADLRLKGKKMALN